ncbi:hemagglutinin repeat-containing protein [Actinobacillus suis]|uniref:Hemagglutinin repeat-containing protein n=2 Tax=Actinobacillus suis TaxID=716 RepID=A0ABT1WSB0_ACTSU|nr:hemagglutinin repeat-containing protein [Actinobacillus suis]MCQ9629226.1 hemagglutinin repeat-containing protein [Actinobacillus suis]
MFRVFFDYVSQFFRLATTIIVDIANPEHDGVSDNRFQRFNIPNSAVFNNNFNKDGKSQIVGDIERNKNLTSGEARTILSQVTGKEQSTLRGGLEVSGGKADLLIINPNGVTLNGVQAINSNRLTVSTSNVIDPKNGLNLDVGQGKILIDSNGVATDGLAYFDIVSKTIELKGAVKSKNKETDVRLLAGGSKYDVKNRTFQSKGNLANKPGQDIAISGSDLGAMNGRNIELITTDFGAGVSHKGALTSRENIRISSLGHIELGGPAKAGEKFDAQTLGNINVGNAVSAKNVNLDSSGNSITLSKKAQINAQEQATLTAKDNITLGNGTSIASKHGKLKAGNNLKTEKDSKISASETLTLDSTNAQLAGVINANKATLTFDSFKNTGNITTEDELNITTDSLYDNQGNLVSNNNAKIQFGKNRDKDFNSKKHKLAQTKNNLIVLGRNAHIEKNYDVENFGKIKFGFTNNFTNEGAILSNDGISVAADEIDNKGFIGAKNIVNLFAGKHITNQASGFVHSEKGDINLNAPFYVFNYGVLSAGHDVNVYSHKFQNRTVLAGNPRFSLDQKYRQLNDYTYRQRGSTYDTYTFKFLKGLNQFDLSDLKTQSVGRVKAGHGFNFYQDFDTNWKSKEIDESVKEKFRHLAEDADLAGIVTQTKVNAPDGDYNFLNQGIINTQNNLTVYANKGLNDGASKQLSVQQYFKQGIPFYLEHFREWHGIPVPLTYAHFLDFSSLDEFFDSIIDGKQIYDINPLGVFKALAKVDDPTFQKMMSAVFGPDWKGTTYESYHNLVSRWKAFKENPNKAPVQSFYGNQKALLLSGNVDLNIQDLGNGNNADKGTYDQKQELDIGKHKLEIDQGNFKPLEFEKREDNDIDTETLEELLNNPYIFVPKPQPKPNVPKVQPDVSPKTQPDVAPKADMPKTQPDTTPKAQPDAPKAQPKSDGNRTLNNLYQTRAGYINQDEYYGIKHFFDKVKPDDHNDYNVIGDNYFQHQLITRSLEKKIGNYYQRTNKLTDKEAVGKLMDNAKAEAEKLGLEIGKPLTDAQRAALKSDIIWYVKTKLNGQEVLIPQVYLSKQTIADAEKAQGSGSGSIVADNTKVRSEDFYNAGQVSSSEKNDIKAENKVINHGGSISGKNNRIEGKRGIDSTSKSYIDDKGNQIAEKNAHIEAEKHNSLITDKDADINLKNSVTESKTSYVHTRDLNLKDQHTVKSESKTEDLHAKSGRVIGGKNTTTKEATSEGASFKAGHSHLAVHRNFNQEGSDYESDKTTGVVKGKYDTKAGKNISHTESVESTISLGSDVSGGFGGYSFKAGYSDDEGTTVKTDTNSSQSNLQAQGSLTFKTERNKRTELTHRNSTFKANKGKLNVLGEANIGGVDINADPNGPGEDNAQDQANDNTAQTSQNSAANPNATGGTAKKVGKPKLPRKLTEQEINENFKEKDESFYEEEAKKSETDNSGFHLVAKKITSEKQKNEIDEESQSSSLSLQVQGNVGSGALSAASNAVKGIREQDNGKLASPSKALQHASDAFKAATGPLVNGSVGASVRSEYKESQSNTKSDNRTRLGGKTTLVAQDGDVDLTAVDTDSNSDLTTKASGSVNYNAGKTETTKSSTQRNAGVSASVGGACTVAGCFANGSLGVSGGYKSSNESSTTYQNSKFRGKSHKVEAGGDFNLNGANVDADKVDLNVQGKTRVNSLQDTKTEKHHSFDANLSLTGSLNSNGFENPGIRAGIGGGFGSESKAKVGEKSGISANQLSGQINDLETSGGYVVDKTNSGGLTVNGDITSKTLTDHHDKGGYTGGATLGFKDDYSLSQAIVSGGQEDQVHYKSEHGSAISGITHLGKKEGNITDSVDKTEKVLRDDKIQGGKFDFDVLKLKKERESLTKKPKKEESETANRSADNSARPRLERSASTPTPQAERPTLNRSNSASGNLSSDRTASRGQVENGSNRPQLNRSLSTPERGNADTASRGRSNSTGGIASPREQRSPQAQANNNVTPPRGNAVPTPRGRSDSFAGTGGDRPTPRARSNSVGNEPSQPFAKPTPQVNNNAAPTPAPRARSNSFAGTDGDRPTPRARSNSVGNEASQPFAKPTPQVNNNAAPTPAPRARSNSFAGTDGDRPTPRARSNSVGNEASQPFAKPTPQVNNNAAPTPAPRARSNSFAGTESDRPTPRARSNSVGNEPSQPFAKPTPQVNNNAAPTPAPRARSNSFAGTESDRPTPRARSNSVGNEASQPFAKLTPQVNNNAAPTPAPRARSNSFAGTESDRPTPRARSNSVGSEASQPFAKPTPQVNNNAAPTPAPRARANSEGGLSIEQPQPRPRTHSIS